MINIKEEAEKAIQAIQEIFENFENKITEVNKDPRLPSKKKWYVKPTVGTPYWAKVGQALKPRIQKYCWENDLADIELFKAYNVFETKEEAEAFEPLNKPQRALAMALAYLHGSDWNTWVNWENGQQPKFSLCYDYSNATLKISSSSYTWQKTYNLLHAKNRDTLKQAVELIGTDLAEQTVGVYTLNINKKYF